MASVTMLRKCSSSSWAWSVIFRRNPGLGVAKQVISSNMVVYADLLKMSPMPTPTTWKESIPKYTDQTINF